MNVVDTLDRPLKDLRLSVTDRCNYRCNYCMPFDEYAWSPKEELLTYEELVRLVGIFLELGVEKVRLTGGEPLVRSDLEDLVRALSVLDGLDDLSLTTNGSLLGDKAVRLREAGLGRINVSLDTLRPERFAELTRRGDLGQVLDGIDRAEAAGLAPIKINTVVMRGVNDDEILDLVEYCRDRGFEMRFIEFMDVGNANKWSMERTVTKREILETVGRRYPLSAVGRPDGRAPAEEFRFRDTGQVLGIIGSVTEPFCSSCTRARMTADGRFVTCLFSESGFDLRTPMRGGASDQELGRMIAGVWNRRDDRYSDRRWESIRQGKPVSAGRKIEMITLGG